MDRKKLIDVLVAINSTFQFTRDWLSKQRTGRLRSLVLAAVRQGQVLEWLDHAGSPPQLAGNAALPAAAPEPSAEPSPASGHPPGDAKALAFDAPA